MFGNSWVDPQSVANNSKCAADCNQASPNETCLVLPAVSEFYCGKVYDVHKSPLAVSVCLFLYFGVGGGGVGMEARVPQE